MCDCSYCTRKCPCPSCNGYSNWAGCGGCRKRNLVDSASVDASSSTSVDASSSAPVDTNSSASVDVSVSVPVDVSVSAPVDTNTSASCSCPFCTNTCDCPKCLNKRTGAKIPQLSLSCDGCWNSE